MSVNCPICMESLSQGGRQALSCEHVFHESCVLDARRRGNSARCPVCRSYQKDLQPLAELVKQADEYFANGDYKGCFETAVAVRDLDSEHEGASVLLADLYHHGKGVAQNIAEAMVCYEVAARRGNEHAIVNLGHLHYEEGNIQQAQQLFERVSETGNPIANYNLWLIYRDQGDWERAQGCLEVAAEAGDIDAKFKLALLYAEQGNGRGEQLMEDIGDRFGELHDYDLLEEVWGGREETAFISYDMAVKRQEAGDLDEAKRLYLKASNNGYGDASYNLGCIYRQEGNTRNALPYLGIASDKGVHEATFTLALMQKIDGNIMKAMSLCDLAMQQGSIDAISTLASMHEDGGDLAKAKYYYDVAARKGCPYGLRGMFKVSALEKGATLPRTFGIGDRIQVHGLLTEQGKMFNGEQGIVVDVGSGDRCTVRIDGHENMKMIKYANLEHAPSREAASSVLVTPFCNGDRVVIQGLQSHQGQGLNGKCGTVVGATETGRWGVKVDGLDVTKSLKGENLTAIPQELLSRSRSSSASFTTARSRSSSPVVPMPCLHSASPSDDPLTLDDDELAFQSAILESYEKEPASSMVNSQVSAALLQTQPVLNEAVVCLFFSRCPRSFKVALESCPVLSAWRRPLAAMIRKSDAEMLRPCKIFVKPEHYVPALEAMEARGTRLTASHVVVDATLEDHVIQLVNGLAKKEQVHLKSTSSLTMPVPVSRTFIHFSVPASSSSGANVHPKTASTTDMDARKGMNPRP